MIRLNPDFDFTDAGISAKFGKPTVNGATGYTFTRGVDYVIAGVHEVHTDIAVCDFWNIIGLIVCQINDGKRGTGTYDLPAVNFAATSDREYPNFIEIYNIINPPYSHSDKETIEH